MESASLTRAEVKDRSANVRADVSGLCDPEILSKRKRRAGRRPFFSFLDRCTGFRLLFTMRSRYLSIIGSDERLKRNDTDSTRRVPGGVA